MLGVILIGFGILLWGVSDVAAADWVVGVKGGASIANLTGDDVFNNSSTGGMAAGGFARYKLSDLFSLQAEVLYAMKGAEFSVADFETEQSITYVDVPVLARVAWHNSSKFEPSLYAGPQIGFLLDNEISDGAEIDLEDGSNGTQFAVVGGALVDYALGPGAVLLDVRYERGLTSWSEALDEMNSVVSFMIGYGYRR